MPDDPTKAARANQEPLATTGVNGLDDILSGGLPRRRIYLVEGDPGVGKTTLALQYLLDGAARGERCLYITLSETSDEIHAIAVSHGWSLEKVKLVELSAIDQSLQMDEDNTLFVPSEVELRETTSQLLKHVAEVNPSRVAFDSLSELRLLAQSALRYRREILALKQYFAGKHCTVLLLDDRSSQPGDLQLESLAHGVISMEQLAPTFGADRRRLRVRKLRGVKFRSGYHDFTIEKGGLAVFPRIVAAEHHQAFPPGTISSGLPELDQLLGGGLDRGTSTLVMGPAGCGKSSIAAQYASAAARRDERVAFFAFDEGLSTLLTRSDALGMRLSDEVTRGRVVITQIDPAEMGPGEFAYRAQRMVETGGVRMVVIDSLNGYLNSMPEDEYLPQQMHELLSYFAQQGVTTLLTLAQHGMLGHMVTPVDLTYLADTVILLRYFEADGRVRKALSVIKKRSGLHENTIRQFASGPKGLEVGPALEGFRGVLSGTPEYVGGAEKLMGAR